MPVELNDDALTTLTGLRIYLDAVSKPKPSDEWLAQVINGVSPQVQSHIGRKIRPVADDEERTFVHRGDGMLEIDEASTVTQVRVTATPKDAASWLTLDDQDWVLEPLDEPVGRRLRFMNESPLPAVNSGWSGLGLHRAGSWNTPWPRDARADIKQVTYVEVTGDWGWETVPGNLELAVQMWAQNIFKRDQAFFSQDFAQGVRVVIGPMPADVENILDSERRASAGTVAV